MSRMGCFMREVFSVIGRRCLTFLGGCDGILGMLQYTKGMRGSVGRVNV